MKTRKCLTCHGTGMIQLSENLSGSIWFRYHCPRCDGTGERIYDGLSKLVCDSDITREFVMTHDQP